MSQSAKGSACGSGAILVGEQERGVRSEVVGGGRESSAGIKTTKTHLAAPLPPPLLPPPLTHSRQAKGATGNR